MNQSADSLPPRAAVIINPAKGEAADVRAMMTTVSSNNGWAAPLFLETTPEDGGTSQARQALAENVDVVIAAGGDGTVRCVAAVLSGTGTALGIIPLGTGNLLARNLGLDINDPAAAAREALTGANRPIDVILARVDHARDQQLFLVMAGLGFDAAVMADTKDGLKDTVGWLAYVDAGIRKLPGRPVKATITIDAGHSTVHRLRGVTCGNCGKLQGGVELFPGARFDDGELDLMVVAPRGRLGWLGVLAGLFSRGRSKDPSVEYFHGRTAEISLATPQAFQLDGDPLGEASHLTLTVDAGALLVRQAGS